MTTATLTAFYKESGMLLDSDDITRNLKLLPDLLGHMLEEGDKAVFTKENYPRNEVEIAISAGCSQRQLEEIVTAALRNSQLVGKLTCQQ